MESKAHGSAAPVNRPGRSHFVAPRPPTARVRLRNDVFSKTGGMPATLPAEAADTPHLLSLGPIGAGADARRLPGKPRATCTLGSLPLRVKYVEGIGLRQREAARAKVLRRSTNQRLR